MISIYIYTIHIYIYIIYIYISIEQLDRLVCRQIANSRYSSQEGVCKDNTRNKKPGYRMAGFCASFQSFVFGFRI